MGHADAPQYLKFRFIISNDESVCPCTATFQIKVKLRFEDGTICELIRPIHYSSYNNVRTCCYDVTDVLENRKKEFGITISPNPAQSKITALYNKKDNEQKEYTIQIVDMKGNIIEEMSSQISNNAFIIDIETIPLGIYLFVLRKEKGDLVGAKRFTIRR